MCVHAKAKTRNHQTSNGRKRCKEYMKRHKIDERDRHGKHSKKASKQAKKQTSEKANKQENKQKVVSVRDKCRFGSNVHNFMVLKHGRHTSKQDSCMNM